MQFWSGATFLKTTEILPLARMLDESGYDGMITSDHMIYPRQLQSVYPDSDSGRPPWEPETAWPDAWVLTGAMAAVTSRLQFSNAVYIAPARPLLEVAKQVATAATLSGGRVSLAAGVGWMREEYALMGQDFHTRGKRLDEIIPALRALWQGGWVSWSGEYYQVPDDDRAAPARAGADPLRWRVRGGAAPGCSAVRRLGGLRLPVGDDAVGYARRLTELRREYGRHEEPFQVLPALMEPRRHRTSTCVPRTKASRR